jgi:L-lactate dehydrogenase complex protein LldF
LRCGACLNVCPVYRRIGGHAYGVTYSGPIGSVVSPNLFGGAAALLPFASTLCGACCDICPVKIDIPRLLLHLRWKENLGKGAPRVEFPSDVTRSRNGMRSFVGIARRPWLIRSMLWFGSFLVRPFTQNGYLKWVPGPFRSWTRGRDFPSLRGR